ncbi:hypothetical protein [Xenorhabdus sp. Sc-CR9]|uniref:hypothetical protein n=1 Tax=Xenorhabdus sp. Sc-CR9 TaxID=2584468 RepID=UPI001F157454|nr:hypothetical protein [Xenorhabdus sp. Sc-CR9]
MISNRDMGKGGNGGVVINQTNVFNVTNGGQFTPENARMMSGYIRSEVYDVLVNETQRDGGLLNQ